MNRRLLAWQREVLARVGFDEAQINRVEILMGNEDVFDPESVDIPEGATDEQREKLIKEAHREFEANKLQGMDRAIHDAGRALVARGFEATDVEGDLTEYRHPNGSTVYING